MRLRPVTSICTRFQAAQQAFHAVDVHGFVQAVGDRLVHQRMVGDLAIADDVLQAGELIGEHRCDQVLGLHALKLRRHLVSALEAQQGQRDARRSSASAS